MSKFKVRKLSEIADIRYGYQFRGKIEPDENGNVDLIQIKDMNSRHEVMVSNLKSVNLESPEKHLVYSGDVLFLSRGHTMYATVVPELERDTIVSNYFFVLHINLHTNEKSIDPGFLAWIMNEPRFQQQLKYFVRGSHMRLISKKDFEGLTVSIPDQNSQLQIVRLNQLKLKEAYLLDQLKTKRAQLVEGVSRQLMSGKLTIKEQ